MSIVVDLSKNGCYERLGILDAKCTSLLQVCVVLAALQSIPVAAAGTPPYIKLVGAASVLVFLVVSFMAVGVLAVDWDASEAEVKHRTTVYNRCRAWTRFGLFLGGVFVLGALIASFYAS